MIDIIHMSPWPLGGSTSYVVNLAKTFELTGVPYRVLRPAKRTEGNKRQMGQYDVFYQNVSWDDLFQSDGVPLLASAPTDESDAGSIAQHVLLNGGKFVFHDPNEFRIYPHWKLKWTRENAICIRETGLKHVTNGVFIPHPFVRTLPNAPNRKRTRHAVSIARTSAVKHSDWILEANRGIVDQKLHVELCGEVNRMWWNFNVKKKYPDIKLPVNAGFERRWGESARICMPFKYMVDLTIFKEDGGGTQYSLLEAMDAGAVPVMTADWCSYPGPARRFGFRVSSATELKDFLLTSDGDRAKTAALRAANYNYLDRVHAPAVISAAYLEALGL